MSSQKRHTVKLYFHEALHFMNGEHLIYSLEVRPSHGIGRSTKLHRHRMGGHRQQHGGSLRPSVEPLGNLSRAVRLLSWCPSTRAAA